jgi:hypothetical protein
MRTVDAMLLGYPVKFLISHADFWFALVTMLHSPPQPLAACLTCAVLANARTIAMRSPQFILYVRLLTPCSGRLDILVMN